VRLGIPRYHGALADVIQSPRFATVYGLLLEAATQKKRGLKVREKRGWKQIPGLMKSWFEKNF
jgi:cell division protein FtsA